MTNRKVYKSGFVAIEMAPKIQKIESLGDLELLIAGDVVSVNQKGFMAYEGSTDGRLCFMKCQQEKSILSFRAKKDKIKVKNGILYFPYGSFKINEYSPRGDEYRAKAQILASAGLYGY